MIKSFRKLGKATQGTHNCQIRQFAAEKGGIGKVSKHRPRPVFLIVHHRGRRWVTGFEPALEGERRLNSAMIPVLPGSSNCCFQSETQARSKLEERNDAH